jgi:hypothetical protein
LFSSAFNNAVSRARARFAIGFRACFRKREGGLFYDRSFFSLSFNDTRPCYLSPEGGKKKRDGFLSQKLSFEINSRRRS